MTAEGRQAEALLSLAGGYGELPEQERLDRATLLHGNPVICTPRVLEEARADAERSELIVLERMLEAGLVVVADDPQAERVRLSSERPGYLNRAARRKLRRPRKP